MFKAQEIIDRTQIRPHAQYQGMRHPAVARVANCFIICSVLLLQGGLGECGDRDRSLRNSPGNVPASSAPKAVSGNTLASPHPGQAHVAESFETRRPRRPAPPPAAPRLPKIRSEEIPPAPEPHPMYVVPVYAYPPYPLEMTKEDAMNVAEGKTGGSAVSAHRISLNGATGGYEVMVRMPGKEKGWRVVIDVDTRNVKDTYPIPNPPDPWAPVEVAPAPEVHEPVTSEPPKKDTVKEEIQNSRPATPGNRLYRWRNSKNVVCITDYPPPKGIREIDGDSR